MVCCSDCCCCLEGTCENETQFSAACGTTAPKEKCHKKRRHTQIAMSKCNSQRRLLTSEVESTKAPVANALIASYELKAMLVALLGPGATSLGNPGVERGWWMHHVSNMNTTCIWSTNAVRQYRAVVLWKHQVRASLRRRLAFIARSNTAHQNCAAQDAAEEMEALTETFVGGVRPQSAIATGTVAEPTPAELNIGLGAFRKSLRREGVALLSIMC